MAVTEADVKKAVDAAYVGMRGISEAHRNHLASVAWDIIVDSDDYSEDDLDEAICEAMDEVRVADQDASDAAEMMGEDYRVFADPGGNSALRAATPDNPRNLPCPTCKEPNRLTLKDKRLGYHCDSCADKLELGGY